MAVNKKYVSSPFPFRRTTMWYSRFSLTNTDSSNPQRWRSGRELILVFCCFFIACLLVACGNATTANNQSAHPVTPTFTSTPTNTPTPTPTPKPTATPKPRPPTPTPQPAASAPILDVAPSSMSIVGHLDCSRATSVFVCQAGVLSRASNQATLHWVAFANVGGVAFTPSQENLAPGTHIILTIRIPVNTCSATFFFQGPANTHTIIWQC